MLDREVDRLCPAGLGGDIEMDEPGSVPQLGGHLPARVVEDVGDHDACSFPGEELGLAGALAAGPAGHQGDPAVKLSHWRAPLG